MTAAILRRILGPRGQVVNSTIMESPGVMRVQCRRDARYGPIDTCSGAVATEGVPTVL